MRVLFRMDFISTHFILWLLSAIEEKEKWQRDGCMAVAATDDDDYNDDGDDNGLTTQRCFHI